MPRSSALVLFAAFVSLALSGCLGSASNSSPNSSCVQSSLVGTWTQACASQGSGGYAIQQVIIDSANTFTYSSLAYSDSACTAANSSANQLATGTMTIGGCGSVSGSNNLDIIPSSTNDVGCGVGVTQQTLYTCNGTDLFFGNNGGSNGTCTGRSTALSTTPFVKQ